MFDFFKKKIEEPVDNQNIEDTENTELINYAAAITFFIESGEPMIDISVSDYEDDSIEGLALLLSGLVGCSFFTTAMDMVKDGLLKEDKPEKLLKLVTVLETLEMLQKRSLGKIKEEPCIKPEDAI